MGPQPGHIIGELAILLLHIDHHGLAAAGVIPVHCHLVVALAGHVFQQVCQCQLPHLLAAHPVVVVDLGKRGCPLLHQVADGHTRLSGGALAQEGGINPHGVLDQLHRVLHHLKLLGRHVEVLLYLEGIAHAGLVGSVRVELDIAIGALDLLQHLIPAHVGGVLVHDDALGLQQEGELDTPQVHLVLRRHGSSNQPIGFAGAVFAIPPERHQRVHVVGSRAGSINQMMRADEPGFPDHGHRAAFQLGAPHGHSSEMQLIGLVVLQCPTGVQHQHLTHGVGAVVDHLQKHPIPLPAAPLDLLAAELAPLVIGTD